MYQSKNYNYLTSASSNVADLSASSQLWQSTETDSNKTSLPAFSRRFSTTNRIHPYSIHRNYPTNSSGYLSEYRRIGFSEFPASSPWPSYLHVFSFSFRLSHRELATLVRAKHCQFTPLQHHRGDWRTFVSSETFQPSAVTYFGFCFSLSL